MSIEKAVDPTLRPSDTDLSNNTDKVSRNDESNVSGTEVVVLDHPDGGLRAWVVVFGSMCNTFSTFGYVLSWGIFQAYYQQNILHDISPSDIAWIGSIQLSLIFLPGLLVGRMFDLGIFRIPFSISGALIILATFLVPECKAYWQFLLCQGVAIGLGCGGIYTSNTAVIGHWFRKRRGVALGLMTVGASAGGIAFPIAIQNLISAVGFPWTMRIVGFILIFTLGLGNVSVRQRLTPVNVAGGLFNFKIFKSPAYAVYCLSSFFAFLGLYTALTFINSSAVFYGVDKGFAFYLIAIANGASGFARFVAGAMSDRVGSMNVMIPLTTIAGIMTYGWPFARTTASLTVIAIIYGFASGAYIALIVNPLIAMGEGGDVGRRIGMFVTILGLGALFGPPISGAINHATNGFPVVGYFAGTMVMVAVALMCITRYLVIGRIWGKF